MNIAGQNVSDKALLIGGGIVVFLLWGPQIVGALTRRVASSAAGSIVEGAKGAVIGVAEAVGIPPTDAQKCEQYLSAGDLWNASLYCPAGTFLKAASGKIFNSSTGEQVGTTTPSNNPEVVQIKPVPTDFEQTQYVY